MNFSPRVAQIFDLLYRRFAIGNPSLRSTRHTPRHVPQAASDTAQRGEATPRQDSPVTVPRAETQRALSELEFLVFARFFGLAEPFEESSRSVSLPGDMGRLQICATTLMKSDACLHDVDRFEIMPVIYPHARKP